MQKKSKIFVAGARGLVGSAIVRRLKSEGFENILTPTSKELDLTQQRATFEYLELQKPEYIFLAAAKVGGVLANSSFPAEFAYINLCIQNNVIHGSYLSGVKKLLFLGSSCIYPREASVPILEDALLTGPLEPTNEAYAVAKIAGLKMCEYYREQYGCDFISAMPTNSYGPNDNYNLETSHLVPALIRKFHEAKVSNAKSVTLWGTGQPRREVIHADDVARACVFLMQNYSDRSHVNVGTGVDHSVLELANLVKNTVGYQGAITFDPSKPDGTYQKVMDVCKIQALGWKAKISLEAGLKQAYDSYCSQSHASASL